jgi:hypothetical protein
MMVHSEKITLTKAARLCILLDMQDAGLLEGKSLAQIARLFKVQRSTILRDKRILPQARQLRARISKELRDME